MSFILLGVMESTGRFSVYQILIISENEICSSGTHGAFGAIYGCNTEIDLRSLRAYGVFGRCILRVKVCRRFLDFSWIF